MRTCCFLPGHFALCLVALISTVAAGDVPKSKLQLSVKPALVEIEARQSDNTIIRLPSIELELRFQAYCAAGLSAEHVTIGSADARIGISRESLDEQITVENTLSIPREQIAPLAVGDFCVAGSLADDREELRVPDAMTVQGSLRCESAERQAIVYDTVAVEIRLSCKHPNEDQEASSEPSPSAPARL